VVVRNKAAEICEKYLSKGDKIYVEGRLKTRQWQGEDGNNRYTTEVHVQDFTFLSTKKESNANMAESSSKIASTEQPAAPEPSKETNPVSKTEQDDDLPF